MGHLHAASVLIALTVAGSAGAQSAPPRPIAPLLRRAEAQLAAGRFDRARALLRRAQRRAPTDAHPLLAAEPLLRNREVGEGTEDARWVLAWATTVRTEDPAEARALRRLRGWALAWLGRTEEALRALVAGPQDEQGARELRLLAAWWVSRGELAKAERALEAAVRALPQDPAPRRDLATLLLARGRPEAAVRLLLEIVRAQPNDRGARHDLAGALLAAGREREALAAYRRLAEDGSDEALLDLAEAALEVGRPAEAAEAAGRAAASERRWAALGLALAALGRRQEARQALRRASGDPRARQALRALGSPDARPAAGRPSRPELPENGRSR